jgi:hypothetical protein
MIIRTGELEDKRFEQGLKFILSHFEHQKWVWPRTISTTLTSNRQVIVHDERYALAKFKQSNLIDCRISAYPSAHTGHDFFLFIDLDLDNFDAFGSWSSKQLLDIALNSTLNKIKQKLGQNIIPTVLWTGNGYHIYFPIEQLRVPLESDTMFCKLSEEPSKKFLKFAATYFTNGKSDPNNNPTFNSCMLRIPGSFNSKCLNSNKSIEDSSVYIKHKWDGYKPSITKSMLVDFYAYLTDYKIKKLNKQIEFTAISKQRRRRHNTINNITISEFENLLQTPIQNYRKYTIKYIIAPYLITIKGLDYNQSFEIINNWLYDKCNELKRLNPRNFNHIIKNALDCR